MANPLPTTGRENLYRADGSRRPDAEVLKEGGHLGLRLALLDDAMHGRAASADYDVQYPSRLFLSYKWGSEAENAWVRQLAHRLTQHRWDVVFDQWRDEAADRSVEEFVLRTEPTTCASPTRRTTRSPRRALFTTRMWSRSSLAIASSR